MNLSEQIFIFFALAKVIHVKPYVYLVKTQKIKILL